MQILCIDPGSRHTGSVILEPRDGDLPRLIDPWSSNPVDFMEWLRGDLPEPLEGAVIEHVGHYGTGMSAGADVFETCILIGRIVEILRPLPVEKVRRQSIKTQLCGRATAKGSNVRQALIDRWGGRRARPRSAEVLALQGQGMAWPWSAPV